MNAEELRLREARDAIKPWKKWGPYLSERQWGTVREDYSANGDAWNYFPHDHARSRAYRWGEDGLAGVCDDHQVLCFAIALWNGSDPILNPPMRLMIEKSITWSNGTGFPLTLPILRYRKYAVFHVRSKFVGLFWFRKKSRFSA